MKLLDLYEKMKKEDAVRTIALLEANLTNLQKEAIALLYLQNAKADLQAQVAKLNERIADLDATAKP